MIVRTECINCGKDVFKHHTSIAIGEGKFCSRKCHYSHKVPDKERFMNKFLKLETGCWEWIRQNKHYPTFEINGIGISSHRASYILFKGKIPEGMLILHSCDNKHCVNPDHLSVGTHRDNILDCIKKGRYRGGFKKGNKDHNRRKNIKNPAIRSLMLGKGE